MFLLDFRMKSKALVLKRKGKSNQAFELQDIDLPALKQDEVLIESESFGLNYADVMARNGLYKDAPPMPCVIGYEAVGVIEQVGSQVDQKMIGQRVLAFCRFGGYGRCWVCFRTGLAQLRSLSVDARRSVGGGVASRILGGSGRRRAGRRGFTKGRSCFAR